MCSITFRKFAFLICCLLPASVLAVTCPAGPPCTDLNTQAKGSRMPYYGTDSGAANAYAITTTGGIGSGEVLQTGSRFYFIATHANTTASTLAVNGGSAIAIKKNVSIALASGDILLNGLVEVVYDGTNFQMLGPGGVSGISGATANGAMYATSATTGTSTGALINGQILIGDTGNPPQANTVTAGAGIGVANGPHTITISATGSSCSAGSPALVGSASASAFSPTLVTATLACTGSLVVVAIQSLSSVTNPLTITGSCVTGWTLAKSSIANTQKGWVYYGTSNTTGACTISSNVTCSDCSILEAEFANANAVVDQSFADYSNGTSSITTSIPALSRTNDVVFSSIGGGLSSGAFSGVAPLANIVGWNPISGKPQELGWYQATGASTQSFNWGITCCGSSWWNDILLLNVAFTTASGSAVFNQSVQVDGTGFAQESVTDYISGTGISLSGADDPANTRTKVTVDLSTPVSVANGGTGDATLTAHGVLIGAGTSAVAETSAGTATQCLTSNGASSDPTFQTCPGAAGQAINQLETHTVASVTSVAFTSCFSSSYKHYRLSLDQITPTTGQDLAFVASTNGGSSYDTTSGHYAWVAFGFASCAGCTANAGSSSDTSIHLFGSALNGASPYSANGTWEIYNPSGSSLYMQLHGQSARQTNGDQPSFISESSMEAGVYLVTTAPNAFEITSGAAFSGAITCYGVTP